MAVVLISLTLVCGTVMQRLVQNLVDHILAYLGFPHNQFIALPRGEEDHWTRNQGRRFVTLVKFTLRGERGLPRPPSKRKGLAMGGYSLANWKA